MVYMSKKIKIHNLTLKMEAQYPYGYYGAIVKGKKGMGKSTYCIHCMAQLYFRLSRLPDDRRYKKLEYNIGLEEAYHVALDHTFFDFRDIVRTLRDARGGLRDVTKMVPGVIWDDAGVYGSSYLWWDDKAKAGAIKKYNDIIRTRLTGWLINTPMKSGLLTGLRETDDPTINIVDWSGSPKTDEHGWDMTINKHRRLATATIKRENHHYGKRIFTDDFRCRLKYKSVKERYITMKEDAFDDTENNIIDAFEMENDAQPAPS